MQFLTDEEMQKILVAQNNTASDFPADKTIHELFTLQAINAPGNIALFYEEQLLTYAELNEKSNQVAHYLRKLGAQPDRFIALCLEPSLELIICILAILKSGAAYVPFDTAYPADRLQFMLEDCNADILITQTKYLNLFKKNKTQLLCIDKIKNQIDKEPDSNLPPTSKPENLAYVIYTSGSTGKPKGVMITHRNVVNFIHWFGKALAITSKDIVDFSSSISFDFSVATTLFPISMGAKIAICPQSKRKDSYLYLEHLHLCQASVIKLTPSRFRQLKEFITPDHTLPALSWLVFGGESTYAKDVEEWLQIFPTHKILNEYGPTETTVATTWIIIDKTNIAHYKKNIPIGKPALNTQAYILNEQLDPVPFGTVGELFVGGVGVAKGYLNQAEATARKFIQNPFINDPNRKLYKTGDLCSYLPDGNIEFVGRSDQQVKIRGFRVELSEIEVCLASHHKIKTVAVIARESRGIEKQLVAYYILNDEHEKLNSRELRAYLHKHLPEYMIPTTFIKVESLPLTPNGKLDYRALPELSAEINENYCAPQTEMEQAVQTIWLEIFKLDYISVEDNFFELGGHSLAAARIISKIGRELHKEIKLQEFYNASTIRELSRIILNAKDLDRTQLHHDQPSVTPRMIPLSEMQFLLWLAQKFHSKSKPINIVDRRRLTGKINIAGLKFALECAIKKHPLFHYYISTYIPVHLRRNNISTNINIIEEDIAQLPLDQQERLLSESLKSLKIYGGWHKNSPWVMAKVFYLNESTSEIQLSISHLISDEISMEILFSDLSNFYVCYMNKLNLNVTTEKISYLDYAKAERFSHQGSVRKTTAFWSGYLKDACPISFSKKDVITKPKNKLLTTYLELPDDLLVRLKSFCSRYQLNITDSLYAAVGVALAPYTNIDKTLADKKLAINLVKSTRDNEAYDNTMGFFVRYDIIKIPLNKSSNFPTLVKEVHHSISVTEPYQSCPGIIKIACLFKKHWENKKISNFFIGVCSYIFTKIFSSLNLNPQVIAMYGRMFIAGSDKYFLAEVNIMNNFISPKTLDNSYLFGTKLQKVKNYSDERVVAKNILDICFERDKLNKNYLIISGNLTSSLREEIGRRILRNLDEI